MSAKMTHRRMAKRMNPAEVQRDRTLPIPTLPFTTWRVSNVQGVWFTVQTLGAKPEGFASVIRGESYDN